MSDTHAKDRAIMSAQIGRPLRGASTAAARCKLGLPIVAKVPSQLDDGTPFPTLYWLTCPLAHRRIARLEADGMVRSFEAKMAADSTLQAEMIAAHEAYATERGNEHGGVAGIANWQRVKCLHAHFAHHAAGGANPAGAAAAAEIEPLHCTVPCAVQEQHGGDSETEDATEPQERYKRNHEWREPARTDDATS